MLSGKVIPDCTWVLRKVPLSHASGSVKLLLNWTEVGFHQSMKAIDCQEKNFIVRYCKYKVHLIAIWSIPKGFIATTYSQVLATDTKLTSGKKWPSSLHLPSCIKIVFHLSNGNYAIQSSFTSLDIANGKRNVWKRSKENPNGIIFKKRPKLYFNLLPKMSIFPTSFAKKFR